jgi:hypothetical protein
LREARSTTSTSTLSPAVISPAPIVEDALIQPVSETILPKQDDGQPETETEIETSNQFATLVDAAAVRFSSTREVDNLSKTAVKIRLSRGQVCYSQKGSEPF